MSRERASRWVVLALILIVLGALRLAVGAGTGPYGLDGSNYFQIARNVAEGKGLVTSVSLYYTGYRNLPAESHLTYPVWPLVLGWTGRAIGMFRAADVLPRFFYFTTLLLAYVCANQAARAVAGRESLSTGAPAFDFGHLFVLLLGTNDMFFRTTTYPYTEGLSFTLMFAAFALIPRNPHVMRFALAGLFAGLAFLTRTQMVVVALAIFIALLWVCFRDRRFWRVVPAYLVPIAMSVAVWLVVVRGAEAERADIAPFAMWIESSTIGHFLRERLDGFLTSLDPTGAMSYFHLLGPVAAVPLLGATVFVYDAIRQRRVPLSGTAEHLPALVPLLAGLGAFASLNLYHETFFIPWLFGYRHGLPYVLLVLVAVPYLATSRFVLVRIATILLVAVSIVIGTRAIARVVAAPRPQPSEAEQQLSEWLERHPRPATVLTTNAQTLSAWSHANFHWILCEAPGSQTQLMLEKLPIDYVVVYDHDRRCTFTRGLAPLLRGEMVFGNRDRIWLLKRR